MHVNTKYKQFLVSVDHLYIRSVEKTLYQVKTKLKKTKLAIKYENN